MKTLLGWEKLDMPMRKTWYMLFSLNKIMEYLEVNTFSSKY
jgi:hypothetical protein